MLNRIRAATPEEIEAIKENSDLDQGCYVLALTTDAGTPLAVVRTAVEVDPMYFPENLSDRMKAVFIRDVETVLAAQGANRYYFNVHATNEKMISYSKHYGAIQLSTEPEFRFKKIL